MIRLWAVIAVLTLALAACGGDDDGSPRADQPSGSRPLTIGALLPHSGDLAFGGPPIIAGVDLAAAEVNEAGGAGGQQVTVVHADSAEGKEGVAARSADELLRKKATVIIGAASSATSLGVLDRVTGAGTVLFSPSSTAEDLSTRPDHGKFFRTAPPDRIQGRVLGRLAGSGPGGKAVVIAHRADAYGTGLASATKGGIESAGGRVLDTIAYDPDAPDPAGLAKKVAAKRPKAFILIAFDETKKIVPQLVRRGLGPAKVSWYFGDANVADYAKDLPKGTLDGVQGTLPGAKAPSSFQKRLLKVRKDLKDFGYAPEAYDATILSSLAAEAARNSSGQAIAAQLSAVSTGGTKCRAYGECVKLIKAGRDIDYDGVSGPVDLTATGDPAEATIAVCRYGADNTYKKIAYRRGSSA